MNEIGCTSTGKRLTENITKITPYCRSKSFDLVKKCTFRMDYDQFIQKDKYVKEGEDFLIRK